MLTPIYLDMRDMTIKSLGKNLKFSKFYVQNIWQVVRRWHHQLTHLHIHTDWSRNVSWKFAKLESVITSLFFQPIFIRFSLFCSENFTLSSEIKLDQLRTSPLRTLHQTISRVPWVWIDLTRLMLQNNVPNFSLFFFELWTNYIRQPSWKARAWQRTAWTRIHRGRPTPQPTKTPRMPPSSRRVKCSLQKTWMVGPLSISSKLSFNLNDCFQLVKSRVVFIRLTEPKPTVLSQNRF